MRHTIASIPDGAYEAEDALDDDGIDDQPVTIKVRIVIRGERAVIDYLKHTARPFVFSASLPPASVAAVGQALQIMRKEPDRRLHLLRIAQMLRDELRARGFNVLPGETAIVPVVVQQELDLCRLCKRLLEEGIYINPVLRPAAAQNLLRISCTAAHTEKHVDRLVATLVRVAAELGIER